jgi:acetyl-CoA carboxylase/biotin carboxylase 1
MNTYVEAQGDKPGERIYRLVGGRKASLASSGDSPCDGLDVGIAYPFFRSFDAQPKEALRSSNTSYSYDTPALFEAVMEQQWQQAAEKNKSRNVSVSETTNAHVYN